MPAPRKHHVREEEWQTVLRRVLELAARDQLRVFYALTDHLGGALWQESARVGQVRLRHEALEAMRAAAGHLGLPGGQAPTIPEFKRAARETVLPMTFNGVYGAFENHWDVATRHFRGERIPATAVQRAARRVSTGRDAKREAPLAGVRLFLSQDPPPAAVRAQDYEAWAKEFNQSPREGYGRVAEYQQNIAAMLDLPWDLVLEVAAGRKELGQAQAQSLAAALAKAGPLVGHRLASRILGISSFSNASKRPGYPNPVVYLGSNSRLWLRAHIEAYAAGRRDFTHASGALAGQYLNSDQLGEEFLGIYDDAVRARVNRQTWDIVPHPAGMSGKHLYWSRKEVERWQREHPGVVRTPRPGRERPTR